MRAQWDGGGREGSVLPDHLAVQLRAPATKTWQRGKQRCKLEQRRLGAKLSFFTLSPPSPPPPLSLPLSPHRPLYLNESIIITKKSAETLSINSIGDRSGESSPDGDKYLLASQAALSSILFYWKKKKKKKKKKGGGGGRREEEEEEEGGGGGEKSKSKMKCIQLLNMNWLTASLSVRAWCWNGGKVASGRGLFQHRSIPFKETKMIGDVNWSEFRPWRLRAYWQKTRQSISWLINQIDQQHPSLHGTVGRAAISHAIELASVWHPLSFQLQKPISQLNEVAFCQFIGSRRCRARDRL